MFGQYSVYFCRENSDTLHREFEHVLWSYWVDIIIRTNARLHRNAWRGKYVRWVRVNVESKPSGLTTHKNVSFGPYIEYSYTDIRYVWSKEQQKIFFIWAVDEAVYKISSRDSSNTDWIFLFFSCSSTSTFRIYLFTSGRSMKRFFLS